MEKDYDYITYPLPPLPPVCDSSLFTILFVSLSVAFLRSSTAGWPLCGQTYWNLFLGFEM